MKSNFNKCLDLVLKEEGGYVNDPDDRGGETNFGISKSAYPNENIRAMTKERAAMIYKRDYWDAVRGDDLPFGLDYVAFDAAVNSGVSRGAKWLQRALGVTQDGRIGPNTIAAANKGDRIGPINRALDYRLSFLKGLKTWGKFGRGWQNRVDRVRKAAIDMVIQAPVAPATPEKAKGILEFIIEILRRIFG